MEWVSQKQPQMPTAERRQKPSHSGPGIPRKAIRESLFLALLHAPGLLCGNYKKPWRFLIQSHPAPSQETYPCINESCVSFSRYAELNLQFDKSQKIHTYKGLLTEESFCEHKGSGWNWNELLSRWHNAYLLWNLPSMQYTCQPIII